jgi:hypothetical protein
MVGGPGFEPGPHGPETAAVSSTEAVFAGLSSFGRLSRGLEGGFSHRRRQDYYMKYYMRGDQVEAGGALLDWVLASDTSTSEAGPRFSSSIC